MPRPFPRLPSLEARRSRRGRSVAARTTLARGLSIVVSPRHPDGLEIARIGIDDGNVRGWRFSGHKLWLQTSDDRGDAARRFVWSLDLTGVL
jgi:hypothetical protein